MMTDCTAIATQFIETEGSGRWFDMENHPALYFCRFHKDHYRDDLFAYYDIFFPEQLKNAVVKRRAEFLVGRYCAANALMHQGITDFRIDIGRHRNPLWPDGILGAISHCNDYAVAVTIPASKSSGIGIDIEELVTLETAERLQSQILYGAECLLLDGANKPLLFTLAFSVKESFFKAAYPRVQEYFNFDVVTIIDINLTSKTITLEIAIELAGGFQKGQRVTGYFYYLSSTKLVTLVSLVS